MAAYGSVPTLAADCGVGVGVTAGIVGKFNLSCKSLLVAVGAVTADTAETVGADEMIVAVSSLSSSKPGLQTAFFEDFLIYK